MDEKTYTIVVIALSLLKNSGSMTGDCSLSFQGYPQEIDL